MANTSPIINQISRTLAGPFLLLLVFSLTAMSGLILYVTQIQNESAINKSIHLATAVIERQKKSLAAIAKESAYWDQAVENLVTSFDPAWADGNVGAYVHDSLGISSTYVLGPGNQLIYSSMYGSRSNDDPLARFDGGLELLIARAQSGEENTEPKAAVGLLRDTGDGAVHFVAAVELTTYFEKDGAEVNRGTDAILIFTIKIDDAFALDIAASYLLRGFRYITTPSSPDTPSIPLTGPNGAGIGTLVWEPDLPGNQALPILLTAVVAVFVLMLVTAYVFMRRAATVARESEDLLLAKELADQSSAFKSKFLASMSHELRTLLNAILGFGQLLKMGIVDETRDDDRIALEQIEINGKHLLALVDQILSLAKIEQGRVDVDLRAVDTHVVVQECIDITSNMATEKGVSVIWDRDRSALPRIVTDRMKFKQILVNFLTNGIKYNVMGGKVDIRAELDADKAVTIYVDDTGQGIADDQKAHVFQPFDRLGRETSNIEGTGIGLSLSRELALRINAEIGFSSTLGQGSSFWIRLPLDKPA
jgi:signal transduction histidine kinase